MYLVYLGLVQNLIFLTLNLVYGFNHNLQFFFFNLLNVSLRVLFLMFFKMFLKFRRSFVYKLKFMLIKKNIL